MPRTCAPTWNSAIWGWSENGVRGQPNRLDRLASLVSPAPAAQNGPRLEEGNIAKIGYWRGFPAS